MPPSRSFEVAAPHKLGICPERHVWKQPCLAVQASGHAFKGTL